MAITTISPSPAPMITPGTALAKPGQDVVEAFRSDRMIADVHAMGGPRVAGTADAKRAAEHIRDVAGSNGWDARVEHTPASESGGGIDLYNVVADRRGTGPDGQREVVMAGAHLDSVPGAFGANDDASGAAALLEGTRVFSALPTKHDLKFVWFDGEEQGLLGSKAYVAAHKDELPGVRAMIVAEMLGSPNGKPYFVFMDDASSSVAAPVARAAQELGLTADVEVDPRAGSDHMPFARAGVPSMVVASAVPRNIGSEDPNYHQPSDTPDKLNPKVFEASGDLFGLAVSTYANGA